MYEGNVMMLLKLIHVSRAAAEVIPILKSALCYGNVNKVILRSIFSNVLCAV